MRGYWEFSRCSAEDARTLGFRLARRRPIAQLDRWAIVRESLPAQARPKQAVSKSPFRGAQGRRRSAAKKDAATPRLRQHPARPDRTQRARGVNRWALRVSLK